MVRPGFALCLCWVFAQSLALGRPATHSTYCDVSIIVETLENTNTCTPTISRIAALFVIDNLSTAVGKKSKRASAA
jgi:RpiR family carbohydrate utilization transcriptional regulator